MLLIPAIDLKDGQCVRLRQGRMEDSTVFADDPLAVAQRWVDAGARRLHLVDLNGAFAGKPVNGEVVRAVAARFPQLPVQIGGGIRDAATVATYLEAGVQFCIIGTRAVQEPAFVVALCRQFPGHIIVGIDARNGQVATDGWAAVSSVAAIDLAREFEQAGVSAIVYTDIARDGMMQGVNVGETARLAASIRIPVIASGGVTDMGDIQRLLAEEDKGIMGAILGRSIYEGRIDLAEAQRFVDRQGQV
ncbi:MAG TPA: 1-(5-phosphoribosyl)-5-[(5-phosphoribosylamino)methylideneamino]imidazole-4-carboxamide isomerase [Thiolinea sp.]|nr:1-(5-phosphoribosyl)-5-[(5-phosphoribosylamino)methylideneamino]imidazole-4-carboxamide isomerase [Thiolinea sp.]